MNILLINHERPPIGGGGGVFTNLLGQGLAQYGNKVYFLTIGSEDSITEEQHNFFVIKIKTGRNNYANIKTADLINFWLKFPKQINKIISKYKIDIVNPHFIHTSAIANFISFNKLPVIVSALGADVYDPTRYKSVRAIMNAFGNIVIKKCSKLILSSADMLQRAQAIFPAAKNKCAIIPHCIDSDLYKNLDKSESRKILNLSANEKIIISVCRLVKRKNLLTALNIIKELLNRRCSIKYIIIGEGPQKNELKQTTEKLGITDSVYFLDYISEKELPLYYSAADIFFLPSFHEAFGIAALEAMAAKTPAVCSANSGWTDFIINYNTGFICSDYNDYLNKIFELLSNKELYNKLSENAAALAIDKYDYRTIAQNYLKFFISITD